MSTALESREARYGMPAADQIIINRYYTVGYSYYFRQAKWALEIVDPKTPGAPEAEFDRLNNFRPDYRIPEMFRANLDTYKGSIDYDRGHLVASANQDDLELQNSETFLLSNMSPQKSGFNRGIWKELEGKIRDLNAREKVFETFVICGPYFDFNNSVETIGDGDEFKVPVPNGYFKSILAETNTGRLKMWSFMFPNEATDKPLEDFRRATSLVESYVGVQLWSILDGEYIKKEKNRVRPMW